jgi:RNA polymerase sigma-70 factor (ECF subfamily)
MAEAEALFAAHQGGLLRYLTRVVGQTDAARDLVQDVFVRILRADAMPTAEPDRRAWVFGIARNLALDHHRRQRVRGSAVALPDNGRTPTQETRLAVAEALGTLEPLDRDVFLLREEAGLSYDEIATTCGLTADAVRSRIHRSRLLLRARLAGPIAVKRRTVFTT